MGKRNRFDEETAKAETTEETKVELVEEVVQTASEEEKVEESTTKNLDDMSDAELLAYMRKRKADQAEKYAIKEAKLPMHVLVQKTVIMPKYTDTEMQMRNRMNRLQKQFEQKKD